MPPSYSPLKGGEDGDGDHRFQQRAGCEASPSLGGRLEGGIAAVMALLMSRWRIQRVPASYPVQHVLTVALLQIPIPRQGPEREERAIAMVAQIEDARKSNRGVF